MGESQHGTDTPEIKPRIGLGLLSPLYILPLSVPLVDQASLENTFEGVGICFCC